MQKAKNTNQNKIQTWHNKKSDITKQKVWLSIVKFNSFKEQLLKLDEHGHNERINKNFA